MNDIEILDCTLRDGSYPINYAYSLEDTMKICQTLELSGVMKIEVGHGMGLGASEKGYGKSAFSDLEYIDSSVGSVKTAQIGVFAIPGIAEEEHVIQAHHAGISFIRVGTDVDKIAKARKLIEFANSIGLSVSLNVMKSYARTKEELLREIQKLKDLTIETVSIVDSAGTMIPDEVYQYVHFLVQNIDNPIGFHGHNNLQLAIANSLAAVEAGAKVVDATLKGIGRSSGNAQIEVLVPVLLRSGYLSRIDYKTLSDFSDLFYAPPYPDYGVSGIELACGVSGLHSSFLPKVVAEANARRVDIIQLIERVTSIDKVMVDKETLEKSALSLPKIDDVGFRRLSFSSTTHSNFLEYIKAISLQAEKFGLTSILTLSPSESNSTHIAGITKYDGFVIGHVEISESDVKSFKKEHIRSVNQIGIDKELLKLNLQLDNMFVYSEKKVVSLLLEVLITNIKLKDGDVPIEVLGEETFDWPNVGPDIDSNLSEVGNPIIIVTSKLQNGAVLELSNKEPRRVIFLHPRYVPDDFRVEGSTEVYRIDSRNFFDLNIIAMSKQIKFFGNSEIKPIGNTFTVAGGLIAPRGTIVLDSSDFPKVVLGVASGKGTLLSKEDSEHYKSEIESVNAALMESSLRLLRSSD